MDATTSSSWAEKFDPEYAARRQAARRQVHQEVDSLGCRLIGSWAVDEFHLDRMGRESFSDIDAWHPDSRTHKNHVITLKLEQHEVRLRLSIHGSGYNDSVSRDGFRIFALLNVAQSIALQRPPGHVQYEVCKAFLMMSRIANGQSYSEVARTLGHDGILALRVKLGATSLTEMRTKHGPWRKVEAAAQHLLNHHGNQFELEDHPREVIQAGINYLRTHPDDYPNWLRTYAVEKYKTALGFSS